MVALVATRLTVTQIRSGIWLVARPTGECAAKPWPVLLADWFLVSSSRKVQKMALLGHLPRWLAVEKLLGWKCC
jgi:hypothetical protein